MTMFFGGFLKVPTVLQKLSELDIDPLDDDDDDASLDCILFFFSLSFNERLLFSVFSLLWFLSQFVAN